jgi:hypothetical protein
MQQPTRRGVLATLGLAATSGCSQLSGLTGGDSDLRGEQVEQISKTFTLEREQFMPFPLSFDTQSVLTFSVVADENVDVITFTRPNFRKYKQESSDQVPFIDAFTEQNTKATAKGSDVSAGKPVVVVDNTTWAKTPPIDEIQVEMELEAFVRPKDDR